MTKCNKDEVSREMDNIESGFGKKKEKRIY